MVLECASSALDSLASFLEGKESGSGDCFFGKEPSSFDAFVLGHLLFYRSSQCTTPDLQRKVQISRNDQNGC